MLRKMLIGLCFLIGGAFAVALALGGFWLVGYALYRMLDPAHWDPPRE
jgi:hypothetical protein